MSIRQAERGQQREASRERQAEGKERKASRKSQAGK
jgi:hypothetical protein